MESIMTNGTEKEFSGTEKSVFMEEIRKAVIELTDVLIHAEAELITDDKSITEIRKYISLRGYFRRLILLTRHKIDDNILLKKCDEWLKKKVETDKKNRLVDIQTAGELITEYLGIMTDIGIIDIYGNSFSNKYPFAEIVMENIGVIDTNYLADFDKDLLDFIISRHKDKMTVNGGD